MERKPEVFVNSPVTITEKPSEINVPIQIVHHGPSPEWQSLQQQIDALRNLITGLKGATGATGPTGSPGLQGSPSLPIFIDIDDTEEPIRIPGQQGIQGIQGPSGVSVYIEQDLTDDYFAIPVQGATGATGVTGATGATGGSGSPSILVESGPSQKISAMPNDSSPSDTDLLPVAITSGSGIVNNSLSLQNLANFVFAVNPSAIQMEIFSPGPEAISAMPAAATLTGTEIVPLVQGGGNVQDTLSDIATYVGSVLAVPPSSAPVGEFFGGTGGGARFQYLIYANGQPNTDSSSNLYSPNGSFLSTQTQALVWGASVNTFMDYAYNLYYSTGNTLLDFVNNLYLDTVSGTLIDGNGSSGSSGYVLTSQGSGLPALWQKPISFVNSFLDNQTTTQTANVTTSATSSLVQINTSLEIRSGTINTTATVTYVNGGTTVTVPLTSLSGPMTSVGFYNFASFLVNCDPSTSVTLTITITLGVGAYNADLLVLLIA